MTGPLRDVKAAAEWLGIPATTLQAMVSGRRVPFTFIGKHVRFADEHLEAIVRAGEQQPMEYGQLAAVSAIAPPFPPSNPPTTPPPPSGPATPPPPAGPKARAA